ncbi:MAG TPA: M14 family zinc carboxypeptidase [Bacteroidales bacterium]|nr:M14 family zinc carboxypeptidase [Bacteroidales bacterium]
MRALFFMLIALFLFSSHPLFATWRKGEKEVKVYYQTEAEVRQLQKLNFSADYCPGYAWVYVVDQELEQIKHLGLDWEIVEDNLDLRNGKGVPAGYYSYQEIIDIADSLAQHFPSICQKSVVGYSLLNRQLAVLKISDNVMVEEPEPEVLFDAGIHGDEVGGPQNAILFAREIILNYGVDPDITALIDSREIYIYLMVNPDGRESMSRYNNNGVDINREWGYMWNGEGGSEAAFTEQETRALRDFILDHEFTIHTTYHSGTEYISCPWSYRADPPADADLILFLAGLYSAESGYANLEFGQGSTGMYYINGASKDYNYGAVGSVSWSMEISMSKQPPASQIGMYYEYNKPAMLAMIEYGGYGLQGTITNAVTGNPVPATVLVDALYPVHNDPVVGDYHKYLMEGVYSVTIKANGFEEVTIENVVVEGNTTVTTLDVALNPREGQYISRLVLVEIPGNNFDDEAFTPAIFGAPDGVYYSLGKDGFIHFDMGSPVYDKPGLDMVVYEGDLTDEGYTLFASATLDGPWSMVGTGTGTTEFDLNASGLVNARYYKIQDDGDGVSGGADAGFDLDAVAVINPPLSVVNISPEDGMAGVSVYTELQWQQGNGGLPDYYQLSFGTDNPPSNILNGLVLQADSYLPDLPLDFLTTYYWRVDAVNQFGMTTGSVWHFTTAEAPDEDFETGDFSAFSWDFSGDMPWIISEEAARHGAFGARSGPIGDNQTSSLMLSAECQGFGKISFMKKTASDPSDVLEFYMNSVLMGSWGGEQPWTEHTYNTGPGPYTFEWRYVKDASAQRTEDGVMIDFIYFPEFSDLPTVNAGQNQEICEGDTVFLHGLASNYTSLQWLTSGDGTFNNPSVLSPEYYHGDQDVEAGEVVLTLIAYGGEQAEDAMVVAINPLPGVPVQPQGDDIPGYNLGEYVYTIPPVTHAEAYYWEIMPTGIAEILVNGDTALHVDFNPYTGPAEIYVRAINACGESQWSESLTVYVDYIIGTRESHSLPVSVVPNPAREIIRILGSGSPGLLEIFSLDGQRRMALSSLEFGVPVDIRSLERGVYLLRFTQPENRFTVKLVK